MARALTAALIAAAGLTACSPSQPQANLPTTAPGVPVSAEPPRPAIIETAPPQSTAVDPRSTEAAQAIVRTFVGLLLGRKFDEAYMLLGPGAPSRSAFDQTFSAYSRFDARIGDPGPQEGAAGSSFLTIPLHISGTLNGRNSERDFYAVLRRVNDVPGSTDAQRHWHIERIDTHPD